MAATCTPAPPNGGDDASQVLVNVGEYSSSRSASLSKTGKVALADHPTTTASSHESVKIKQTNARARNTAARERRRLIRYSPPGTPPPRKGMKNTTSSRTPRNYPATSHKTKENIRTQQVRGISSS